MLYYFLLYTKTKQSNYICILSLLILPPLLPSHHPRLPQSVRLDFLCCTATSHQLSILHTTVYIYQCYFFNLFHPLLPPLCPLVSSLCLHLHSFPANGFISTISLDSIYMRYYAIFIFLLMTYFTVYNRLQVHPLHWN